MKILKIIVLAPLLAATVPTLAQDLHFSQFMNAPMSINPANTGFIPGGDYRIGINYRNQWSSVMTVPYQTMSAFGDMQLMQNDNGWLGAGALILHDVAGSGNLTSTKLYASIAYHQTLNLGSLISAGFSFGYANKQINTSNLKFPDQFDGHFFDNHLPTSVVLDRNNISYFDMQAGMNYAYFPNENTYLNGGFSTSHINRPRESFFDPEAGVDNRIPMRHTAFVNGSFKLNEQWIINPNSYFSLQAKSHEWLIGANAHYNLSGDGEKVLIGGIYYRSTDAVIPMIGIGLKDYTFSFTYDATISTLQNYNNTRGAFEFSLVKQGAFQKFNGNRHDGICPSFRSGY